MNNQDKVNNKDVAGRVMDLTSSFKLDDKYVKYEEMYAELLRLGIAKKQHYNKLPLDTIGRKRYKELEAVRKKNKWV